MIVEEQEAACPHGLGRPGALGANGLPPCSSCGGPGEPRPEEELTLRELAPPSPRELWPPPSQGRSRAFRPVPPESSPQPSPALFLYPFSSLEAGLFLAL